ncbi:tRNA uridine-5-carboxymethylaminomethyl(34) synthesis enzyme MnmG [Candidatus Mycalebacterium sp.]
MSGEKSHNVIVIGGGHAGCEAALAAARMGRKTLLLTANIETIGVMSCNPSIGGVGKGHIVREIDALGGEMAKAADASAIQYRTLNTRKGAAVRATRSQADRQVYRAYMRRTLEECENLDIKQRMIDGFFVSSGTVRGVKTSLGESFFADSVVVTPGTFPNGLIHVGDERFSSGRAGEGAAMEISKSFQDLGLEVGRLKTGTPPRFDGRTIRWEALQEQKGDENPRPFSFSNERANISQMSCFITHTNEKTHEVIRKNLSRSPLYSGVITGVGPRYCPSVEDKIVKFPDKTQHQIFLEPEGRNTYEIYPNGISTSLPLDVQTEMARTIEGLENVEIMRPGYAVEYDFINPTQLNSSLECKYASGLFFAGQVNGTTGYEEAAGQGIVAGINAALYSGGDKPLVLDRSDAYIGIMIDDLVTKGVDEPYRMFTSRAEYRLVLREDNADLRLMEKGRAARLINDERYEKLLLKKEALDREFERLEATKEVPGGRADAALKSLNSPALKKPHSLAEILRRPGITYSELALFDPRCAEIAGSDIAAQAEMRVKYSGYVKMQTEQLKRFKRFESMSIPAAFDYSKVSGLSIEIVQKLSSAKPDSLGQAGRVSGVTPAAVSVLMLYLRKGMNREGQVISAPSSSS